MDDTRLLKYKTVLCQRKTKHGSCRYGILCNFAHSELELRRPLNTTWYYGVKCEDSLCKNTECKYAHNDMEVMYHPHIYKTKLCAHFMRPVGCLKEDMCSFAHGKQELRTSKFSDDKTFSPNSQPLQPSNDSIDNNPLDILPILPNNNLIQGNAVPICDILQNVNIKTSIPITSSQSSPMILIPEDNNNPSLSPSPTSEIPEEEKMKVKILDLVDQITTLHIQRTNLEQENIQSTIHNELNKTNLLLKDANTSLIQLQQENFQSQQKLQELYDTIAYLTSAFALLGLDIKSNKQEQIFNSFDLSSLNLTSLEILSERFSKMLHRMNAAKKLLIDSNFESHQGPIPSHNLRNSPKLNPKN